jgi:hypothetical protein
MKRRALLGHRQEQGCVLVAAIQFGATLEPGVKNPFRATMKSKNFSHDPSAAILPFLSGRAIN